MATYSKRGYKATKKKERQLKAQTAMKRQHNCWCFTTLDDSASKPKLLLKTRITSGFVGAVALVTII
jgi:hypothetical protein